MYVHSSLGAVGILAQVTFSENPPRTPPRPPAASRRAPRLGPEEFIAAHMTRLGRFRKINPLKPRKLPSFSKFLGVIGWALLVEESLRRARKASAADAQPAGVPDVPAPAARE